MGAEFRVASPGIQARESKMRRLIDSIHLLFFCRHRPFRNDHRVVSVALSFPDSEGAGGSDVKRIMLGPATSTSHVIDAGWLSPMICG